MDFIGKLFPFKSLIFPDGNTLTAWWSLVTLVIFAFYVYKLLNVTRNLRRRIQLQATKFSEEIIQDDQLLGSIWKDYRETFIDFNGQKKTDEFSYEYFNEKNLLSSNTNLGLINSIPATLVGLGILGTFVGLTYGISNFQTASADEIKTSIETLLSGMGTAFVTSIYGMLLSIVFTFFDKVQIDSLHNSIHGLCYNLDKRFRISRDEERKMDRLTQTTILDDFFIYNDEKGRKIKPANVFRDIYAESVKQSIALQCFSTDLANLIEAGFEKILNDPDRGVVYELQSLKEEIVEMGSKIQAPANEMTNNVVSQLEVSMKSMIEDFKETMSGSTKSELQGLTNILVNAGQSLNDFPDKLDSMTSMLNSKFMGLLDSVQKISKDSIEQSDATNKRVREQLIEMGNTFKANIGNLQSGQESLIDKQNENLNVSENLLKCFNESIDRMHKFSDKFGSTIDSFESVKKEMNNASVQMREISELVSKSTHNLKSAQSEFLKHHEQQMNKSLRITSELQSSLERAKDLHSEYAQNFTIIDNGLKGIFDKIQIGLTEYKKSVESGVKQYLESFTTAFTDSVKNLNGAVSNQSHIVEELHDLLEKIQTNKR